MRSRIPIAAICLCLVLPFFSVAQDRSSYDPMARQAPKKQQSLADFALKQLNSCDIDYGQQIEDLRRIAIEESVGNISFWTTSVALFGLLSCLVIIVHQSRESRRRESIAADLLARVHNAWVEARERVLVLTTEYNGSVESRNQAEESGPRLRPQVVEHISDAGQLGQSYRSLMVPILHRNSPRGSAIATGQAPVDTTVQKADKKPASDRETSPRDVNPAAQASNLQQQLNASREREKHLEQQLNRSQRLLQAEQQRNNSVKRP